MIPPRAAKRGNLPARLADVGSDHDQAVLPAAAGGPDLRAAQRPPGLDAAEGTHERRPGAEQKRLSRAARPAVPPQATVSRSEYSTALTTTHVPSRRPASTSRTRGGPPSLMSARLMLATSSRLIAAAALLRDEVAQVRGGVAESGIPRELGLADRDQAVAGPGPVDVGSGQPSGLEKRGNQQHAVQAAAEISRRTACSAATSASTWPRSVESLRLISSIRVPRRRATAIRPRAARVVQLDRGRLAQAARVGQDEAGRGRAAERSLIGVLVQGGHDLDAVHGLRPGRVVVQHAEQQAVRGPHGADRRAERRAVRRGQRVARRIPRPRPAGCPAPI